MTEVAILGCGWLGLPLGEFLHSQHFRVKGSTTSPEKVPLLAARNILPFVFHLQPLIPENQQQEWRIFLETDILIINIPPRIAIQGSGFHIQQIRQVAESIPATTCVIYVSSTSVYPDTISLVNETSAVVEENSMIQAENILKAYVKKLTILRCGGLMGYDRIPGKYVAGKRIQTGNVPVNFVHRDDVIRIIYEVIRQEKWNETYNVVAPEHPLRREVYSRNRHDFHYEAPIYDDSYMPEYKLVSPQKLLNELHYVFLYPDPVTFQYGYG